FRSIGHAPIALVLLALSLTGYLVDDRRVTFDCRRDTDLCVMKNDGPWHHEQAQLRVGDIRSVEVVEVGSGQRPERGIELLADSGRLRFGPSELCIPTHDCQET